jgi:hypothetical protein
MANSRSDARAYSGVERRRNRMFLTKNSEYYCWGDTCTAVRDLTSGTFNKNHSAIGRRLAGGVCFLPDGRLGSFTQRGEDPHPGESIFFSNGKLGEELVTSALCKVARTGNALDRTA